MNIASFEGQKDIVRLLIDAGADLNVKGTWGTPLKEATTYNQPEVAAILKAAGATE